MRSFVVVGSFLAAVFTAQSASAQTVYDFSVGATMDLEGRVQGCPRVPEDCHQIVCERVDALCVVAYRALPTSFTPVPLEVAMVGVLIGSAVVGVLITNRRLYALIFMGLAGFGSTLAFVLLQAPDLALTQLLIETVTVILFLAVFRYLPRMSRYSRPRGQTVLDGAIATGVAMTVFTLLVAVQTPIAPRISDFFLEFSKSLGGGYNVVNVILVDFRGYDTMGEIAVLGIVAASVIALLKLSARVRSDEVDPGTTPPPTAPMSADGDAP